MTTIAIKDPLRFRNLLERVAYAASRDKTRYTLNGIHLEVEKDGTLRAIATDGHRLAVSTEKDLPLPIPEKGFTIKLEELAAIKKLIPKKRYSGASLEVELFDDGILSLRVDGKPGTALADIGDFPNWRQVTGDLDRPAIYLEPSSLEEAARELGRVGEKGAIKVEILTTSVKLTAERSFGAGEVRGEAEVKSTYSKWAKDAPRTFAVNGDYFADAIEHVSGAIELRVPEKNLGPISIRNTAGDLAVVMPVRT